MLISVVHTTADLEPSATVDLCDHGASVVMVRFGDVHVCLSSVDAINAARCRVLAEQLIEAATAMETRMARPLAALMAAVSEPS